MAHSHHHHNSQTLHPLTLYVCYNFIVACLPLPLSFIHTFLAFRIPRIQFHFGLRWSNSDSTVLSNFQFYRINYLNDFNEINTTRYLPLMIFEFISSKICKLCKLFLRLLLSWLKKGHAASGKLIFHLCNCIRSIKMTLHCCGVLLNVIQSTTHMYVYQLKCSKWFSTRWKKKEATKQATFTVFVKAMSYEYVLRKSGIWFNDCITCAHKCVR